jgi:hypothetical protein
MLQYVPKIKERPDGYCQQLNEQCTEVPLDKKLETDDWC